MGMEVGIFLAYAAGLLMIYIAGRFLLVPLRWLGWLAVNSAAGGAIILLINLMGGSLGVFVPLNMITAGLAGLLGVPGIIMMAVFFH